MNAESPTEFVSRAVEACVAVLPAWPQWAQLLESWPSSIRPFPQSTHVDLTHAERGRN